MDGFKDLQSKAEFESLLVETPSLEHLGPKLVDRFGAEATKELAARAGYLASVTLEMDANSRVAKATAKWSRRAANRITENGWEDPGDNLSHNYAKESYQSTPDDYRRAEQRWAEFWDRS